MTEDTRCSNVLKEMVTFDDLKFKERDDMEDVISSYLDSHPFDIEKARDNRLRALFKERYDFRKNLCDWDFQFGGLKSEVRTYYCRNILFRLHLLTSEITRIGG